MFLIYDAWNGYAVDVGDVVDAAKAFTLTFEDVDGQFHDVPFSYSPSSSVVQTLQGSGYVSKSSVSYAGMFLYPSFTVDLGGAKTWLCIDETGKRKPWYDWFNNANAGTSLDQTYNFGEWTATYRALVSGIEAWLDEVWKPAAEVARSRILAAEVFYIPRIADSLPSDYTFLDLGWTNEVTCAYYHGEQVWQSGAAVPAGEFLGQAGNWQWISAASWKIGGSSLFSEFRLSSWRVRLFDGATSNDEVGAALAFLQEQVALAQKSLDGQGLILSGVHDAVDRVAGQSEDIRSNLGQVLESGAKSTEVAEVGVRVAQLVASVDDARDSLSSLSSKCVSAYQAWVDIASQVAGDRLEVDSSSQAVVAAVSQLSAAVADLSKALSNTDVLSSFVASSSSVVKNMLGVSDRVSDRWSELATAFDQLSARFLDLVKVQAEGDRVKSASAAVAAASLAGLAITQGVSVGHQVKSKPAL